MFLTENRQTKKHLKILILAGLLLPFYSCGQGNDTVQPQTETKTDTVDYSNVDYSQKSNIIKEPEKLKGDEKAIFYHPYFLKLTSEETRSLDPFKVQEEFAKLKITTDQRERFVKAYSFFKTDCWAHKKSCENWEYFKDLKPE